MFALDPDARPETFEVTVEDQPPEAVCLRLRGEFDAAGAPVLRRCLEELAPEARLTLDLSELTFVDSVGVGVLLRVQRRVADAGHLLVETGVTRAVRRALAAAGLHRDLAIVVRD